MDAEPDRDLADSVVRTRPVIIPEMASLLAGCPDPRVRAAGLRAVNALARNIEAIAEHLRTPPGNPYKGRSVLLSENMSAVHRFETYLAIC